MITQEQLPILHTASMNDTHFEAILLINKLSDAIQHENPSDVNHAFNVLIEHTKEHYAHEEAMMQEKKFPPYPAHKEDHDVSLEAMKKAAKQFKNEENMHIAQTYVNQELTPWFLRHTETMDAVTSMFLENSEAHLPFWERLVPRNQSPS